MKAAFYTLGCKLNQSETEALISAFRRGGMDTAFLDGDTDLFIVNTCTVTTKGEQKARRIIRKALREHPFLAVIVTGCYAQVEREALEELGERVLVLSNDDKDLLIDLPQILVDRNERGAALVDLIRHEILDSLHPEELKGRRFRFQAEKYFLHSRAFLKIQDGCNNQCTYCRTRIARGTSVSLDAETLLERVLHLEEIGYREIVLTGINISAYRSGTKDLARLIELLLEKTHHLRFRLSSLEPDSFGSDLINLFSEERICPHLHIPLQSGSDSVLTRMKRNYRRNDVLELVKKVRTRVPDIFLGMDIIVGFPGESEEDFLQTLDLVKEVRPSAAHLFPYSPRPGTEAFNYSQKVPERITRERLGVLRKEIMRYKESYIRACVGKKLSLLVEKKIDEETWAGVTENYLNLVVKTKDSLEFREIYPVLVLDQETARLLPLHAEH